MKHSARRERWGCARPLGGPRSARPPLLASEEKTPRSVGAHDGTHPGSCGGGWQPERPEGGVVSDDDSGRGRWRVCCEMMGDVAGGGCPQTGVCREARKCRHTAGIAEDEIVLQFDRDIVR